MKKQFILIIVLLIFISLSYCSCSKVKPTEIATNNNIIKPIEWVTITAGNFKMGSLPSDPYANGDEQPQHLVYVNTFQITKCEITNSQYKVFIDSGGYNNSAFWSIEGWTWKTDSNITEPLYWSTGQFKIGSNYPNHPVGGVSWYEADAFCRWIGGGLPTEAQWEKAARGIDSSNYWPWGSVWDSTKCNSSCGFQTHPDAPPDTFYYSSPVGYFYTSVSPYGILDMVGNMWEWVNDWYQSDYYSVSPDSNPTGPAIPDIGTFRVARGGGYTWGANGCRVAIRGICNPYYQYYSNGFRVVK